MFVINPRLFYAFALLALIVAQFDPKDVALSTDARTCVCVEAVSMVDIVAPNPSTSCNSDTTS